MGPLLSGSGNHSVHAVCSFSFSKLQWGRFSVEAEIWSCNDTWLSWTPTSMGPLLSGSGNQQIVDFDIEDKSNFNGAASQWKRKYNQGYNFELWQDHTSMGPLLSGSGNNEVTPERQCVFFHFNGAASQWKRKYKYAKVDITDST